MRISRLEHRRSPARREDQFAMRGQSGVNRFPARRREREGPAVAAAPGPASSDRLESPDQELRLARAERSSFDERRNGLAYAAVTVAILLLVWESIAIAHGLAIIFGR